MSSPVFPLSKKEAEEAGIVCPSVSNKNALFPTRLRELRNKMGLSQARLAEALGVTKSTVGLYETGDNVPDVKTLAKMTKCFGVSADYLICAIDEPTTSIEYKLIHEKTGLSAESIAVLETNKWFKGAKFSGVVGGTDVVNYLLYNQSHHAKGGTRSIIDLLSIYFSFKDKKDKYYTMDVDGHVKERIPDGFINPLEISFQKSLKEEMILAAIVEAIRDVKQTYNLPDGELPGKDGESNGNGKKADA